MPCENIEGVNVPKSLGYEQIGMSIDEFDEAIKYIQDNDLLRKIVPIFKDNKIVLIKIM
ncbi:putative transcriptional regulator with HTH domain [Clostridium beijerinckii]|nr:putative transcriptional regulator with HTH domain [Clostridium beijerinckii]